MNEDIFYFNIFININAMEKLDRNFYKNYYEYRYYCTKQEYSKNSNYRTSDKCKQLLNALNNSFELIKNCSGKSINEKGEYDDFPAVAYKRRQLKQGEGSVESIYACVADTKANQKVNLADIFEYLPLYTVGELKSKSLPDNKIELVTIESTVKDILGAFKKYLPVMGEFCNINTCYKIVSTLSDFPSDSIVEINFNSLITKNEIESCINGFLEMTKK